MSDARRGSVERVESRSESRVIPRLPGRDFVGNNRSQEQAKSRARRDRPVGRT
jgi:hypothetical protein